MTQAVNLANFANNLDSSGGLAPTVLNAPVPVTQGGTNASTASAARTNLGLVIGTDIPSPTGTGASGTWAINISGNAATATNATNATNATFATQAVTSERANTANALSSGATISSSATGSTQTTTTNNNTIATTGFVKNASLGWGQSYYVNIGRSANTQYTNNFGKPILVMISWSDNYPNSFSYSVYVSGVAIAAGVDDLGGTFSFIVPPGATYQVNTSNIAIGYWSELR